MKITDVRISEAGTSEPSLLKAFASIELDDCVLLRGLKIIETKDGLRVYMPTRPRSDGSFQDIAKPLTGEFREYLEKTVLDRYRAGARNG